VTVEGEARAADLAVRVVSGQAGGFPFWNAEAALTELARARGRAGQSRLARTLLAADIVLTPPTNGDLDALQEVPSTRSRSLWKAGVFGAMIGCLRWTLVDERSRSATRSGARLAF
jgi:hypothetical protein